MIFYHTTPKKNIKNILKEGLKIKYSWKFNCIFLSNSIEEAKNWQNELKECYNIKDKFCILKVKVNKFKKYRFLPEIIVNNDISVNNIEVIK